MSIISIMYRPGSLRCGNVTAEEWKPGPAAEVNRDVEDSFLNPAKKTLKLLEFMNEVEALVFSLGNLNCQ